MKSMLLMGLLFLFLATRAEAYAKKPSLQAMAPQTASLGGTESPLSLGVPEILGGIGWIFAAGCGITYAFLHSQTRRRNRGRFEEASHSLRTATRRKSR